MAPEDEVSFRLTCHFGEFARITVSRESEHLKEKALKEAAMVADDMRSAPGLQADLERERAATKEAEVQLAAKTNSIRHRDLEVPEFNGGRGGGVLHALGL